MTEHNISDRSRCILVTGKTNVSIFTFVNCDVDIISDMLADIIDG